MKGKSVSKFWAGLIIFAFLVFIYLGYHMFFLQDQSEWIFTNYEFFLQNDCSWVPETGSELLTNGPKDFVLKISDFDSNKCKIGYCIHDVCNFELDLPCEGFERNSFEGVGAYKILFRFDKHFLYPWSRKNRMSWSLEKVDNRDQFDKEVPMEAYIKFLKEILSERFLWEVYNVPLSYLISSIEQITFFQERVNINFTYTKSLYLMYELGVEMEDPELLEIFSKEISYLNNNIEEILSENKDVNYPEGYLLKLIDFGLDNAYISLIDDYVFDGGGYLSPDLYSGTMRYSEYYRIFREYGYDKLAEYSYEEMMKAYERSGYPLNGICSVYNSSDNAYDLGETISSLNSGLSEINNTEDNLIAHNLYELLICYSVPGINSELEMQLQNVITQIINKRVVIIEDKAILIKGSRVSTEDDEHFTPVISSFNLLDNLMYVQYLHEL